MPETLILRPQIDIGSNILLLLGDVHALGCRPASAENGTLYRFPGASAPAELKSKDCGPSMHPEGLSTVCCEVFLTSLFGYDLYAFAFPVKQRGNLHKKTSHF